MTFREALELTGKVVDVAGVAAIVLGIAYSTVLFAVHRGVEALDRYREYRRRIGRAILLGLELLIAADIIRTVAVTPTFESVGVLALLVVVRTFLSFTLELELEGRWPWQRRVSGGR
jgi:uncharacterized membrane protein